MARDISELGADVIDDSPKQAHRISPKKRNYIIGLSVAGVLLIAAATTSAVLCNTVLLDYSNLSNITYYYTPKTFLAEGEEPTAVLYNLRSGVKYPSTFRIPSRIKGYKVVGVADDAFVGHTEIKKVIMPNTLQFVGERAFYNCTNLESFTWSKNLTSVGVDAFLNTSFYTNLLNQSKTLYDLPSGLLIYVSKDYFSPNTAIVSDEIEESKFADIKSKYGATQVVRFGELEVKDICSGAFKNNDKICYIDLPSNLTKIANSTFENCYNLKGLDSSHCELTEINKRAFANCISLEDIKLPNNLTVVGDEAFMNTALVDYIPDLSNVTSLGESIFADCTLLKSVVYNGTEIPNYTFSGCESLDSITWGANNENIDKITKIGIGAFENTGFDSFIVPKNVSSISDETFKDCSLLEKVSFWGNPNYKKAVIEEEESEEGEEEHEEEETIEEEETNSFIGYDGVERSGTLAGINSIKASAFSGCVALDTIDLYDDSYNHFSGDDGEFTFPISLLRTDGYSTISGSDNHTFSNTQSKHVELSPNTKSIGSYAFSDNKELELVTVAHTDKSRLTVIKANAFEGATNLKKFDLPSSVTTVGAGVFKNCSSLEDVDMGDTKTTSLNGELFYNCQSLKDLKLPETVTAVKTNAFYQNYALESLIIPSKVTEIQKNAFTKARAEGNGKLVLFFDFSPSEATAKINFAGNIIDLVDEDGNVTKAQTWHDETVEVYFKQESSGESSPSYKYWNGDKNNPQIIL